MPNSNKWQNTNNKDNSKDESDDGSVTNEIFNNPITDFHKLGKEDSEDLTSQPRMVLLDIANDSKHIYQLEEDYTYKGMTIPKGFTTDLATIPRLFWAILDPIDLVEAGVIHDFLIMGKIKHDDLRRANYIFFEIVQTKLNKFYFWSVMIILNSFYFMVFMGVNPTDIGGSIIKLNPPEIAKHSEKVRKTNEYFRNRPIYKYIWK